MCKFHVDCGGTWHQHAPTVYSRSSICDPTWHVTFRWICRHPTRSITARDLYRSSPFRISLGFELWTEKQNTESHGLTSETNLILPYFAMFTFIQSYLTISKHISPIQKWSSLGVSHIWGTQNVFQQATSRRCRGRTSVAGPRPCSQQHLF